MVRCGYLPSLRIWSETQCHKKKVPTSTFPKGSISPCSARDDKEHIGVENK
jgi:hypothetical protein